jgi:hypothetical protein
MDLDITRADAEAEANYRQSPDDWAQDKDHEFLCDADTLQNWLCGYMTGIKGAHVDHDRVPHDVVDLAEYLEALDPGQLFALAIQRPWIAKRAMWELQSRYLKYRWETLQ